MYSNKSTKITEGLRKSFKDTDCKMANRICYSYTVDQDGELIVKEPEASVVRWIFSRYLAGDSLGKIAAGLEGQGIKSPTGKAKWNREAISKLLSNEKYTGSVLLQKTVSFCGMQFENEGELEQVLIKGHHEAIISSADFERVQAMSRFCKAVERKMKEAASEERFEQAPQFRDFHDRLAWLQKYFSCFEQRRKTDAVYVVPLEAGYKFFYISDGMILAKEKGMENTEEDRRAFAERAIVQKEPSKPELTEKELLDYRDIVYGELAEAADGVYPVEQEKR